MNAVSQLLQGGGWGGGWGWVQGWGLGLGRVLLEAARVSYLHYLTYTILHYLTDTTYYMLRQYSLLTTACLLPAYFVPTYYLLPTTYYLLPTTYCLLPTTY